MNSNIVIAPWVIIEPDPTDSKFILLHSVLSQRTFRVDKKKAGQPLGQGVTDKWRNFLLAEKLLIDEDQIMPILKDELDLVMHGFSGNRVNAVLFPTYACNLGCVYCYNQDFRSGKNIKRLKAKTIATRIIHHFEDSPAQYWRMVVTGGGEPTLAADFIIEVAEHINAAADRLQREFYFDMITNGLDIKKVTYKKMVAQGLSGIRITLDPEHDLTRPKHNGGPSLDNIIEGLDRIPPEVSIAITSNVAKRQIPAFKRLLKKLKPYAGRLRKVEVAHVRDKLTNDTIIAHADGKRRANGSTPESIEVQIACDDIIAKAGFRQEEGMPQVLCETFMACDHLFINYAGQTTICPGLDNLPEFAEAGKSESELRSLFDYRLANPQWKELCFNNGVPCPYLTKCWGGCRFMSVTLGMGWETINCERAHFDQITRHQLATWHG